VGKVIVFGDGLFAELGHFYLTHDSYHEVVAFTVDREYMRKEELFGLPVVPFECVEDSFPPSECRMIVSISFQRFNRLREERYYQALAKGYNLISFVSSKASTWPGLVIGTNSMVGENSSIQPFARIGNNVVVTSCVMIGHHAVLEDHTFVGPGAMILGGARVESHSVIGANATIREGVTVARGCVISAGVTIARDTQQEEIYINQPSRVHLKRSDQLRDRVVWSKKAQSERNGDREPAALVGGIDPVIFRSQSREPRFCGVNRERGGVAMIMATNKDGTSRTQPKVLKVNHD
jgi:sugar O-acyltransferase (sialic acid O-acetyltransferase NeuD family)